MADEFRKTDFLLPGALYNKLIDAFHLYIAMCIGAQLIGNQVLGGALYLAGQVFVVYARVYFKRDSMPMPASIHARAFLMFFLAALLCLGLFLIYPLVTQHEGFLLLLLVIVLLLLRQGITSALPRVFRRGALRTSVLIGIHLAFSAAAVWVLADSVEQEAFRQITVMVAATGAAMLARQTTQRGPERPVFTKNADRLEKVSAYRIYNSMTASVIFAINITLLAYVCYMHISPGSTMLALFWDLVGWLILTGGLSYLAFLFIRRRGLTRYDKPSVFMAGAAMLLIAIIGGYKGWFEGALAVLSTLLWSAGLACILSIILSMGYDMQAVLELDMSPEEMEGYRENTQAIVEWSLTFSTLIVLVMLTLVTFLSEGRADTYLSFPAMQVIMRAMRFLPVAGIVLAFLYALMQPLNKDYATKLAHYRAQQRSGKVNSALRTRLQMMLIKQPRRIVPDILRAIVRPFMPSRVIGKKNVDLENGPVVFVGNHLEIYGPLITNLHLPFYFRSWIISSMLDREIVAKQLEAGVDNVFHFLPKKLRARLPRLIAPIIRYVLQSLDPIPVYRGTAREVVNTMHLTVDAMEYEDNILLFPENPGEENYRLSGVSDFYSGFAAIGAEYYKRTGNRTTFYPVYANKFKRTLTIGPGIRFDPDNGRREEKERIVAELNTWMNAQAGEPEHKGEEPKRIKEANK